jgi:hypothetical protein
MCLNSNMTRPNNVEKPPPPLPPPPPAHPFLFSVFTRSPAPSLARSRCLSLFFYILLSLSLTHERTTYARTHSPTHSYTHALSLSLPVSLFPLPCPPPPPPRDLSHPPSTPSSPSSACAFVCMGSRFLSLVPPVSRVRARYALCVWLPVYLCLSVCLCRSSSAFSPSARTLSTNWVGIAPVCGRCCANIYYIIHKP